jgi:nicotinamidase-related amidase
LNSALVVLNPSSWAFYNGPLACYNFAAALARIKRLSNSFSSVFIFHDTHDEESVELKYLPPHGLANQNWQDYSGFPTCRTATFRKTTLAASLNDATLKTYDEICVVGFIASFDVLATVFGLVDAGHPNITTELESLGDLDRARHMQAKNILTDFGVQETKLSSSLYTSLST